MTEFPPGTCAQCKATGLPIMPVRYAVVPKNIQPALPQWASGERVTSVDIGPDFQYALRVSRTGYIYLFYDKSARGNNQWECYSVGQDGCLTLFLDENLAQPQGTPDLQCTAHGPVNTQVHYLIIEQPEKCGVTWIAFSQDKWSKKTVEQYTANTKLRNARMQTFYPAKMIAGAKHLHGAIASKEVLEQVLEYSQTVSTSLLPDNEIAGDISIESGFHKVDRLNQVSTRYPWALRPSLDRYPGKAGAQATAKHMLSRAKAVGGKQGTPHVLALWDAMGIAHELNGFRNDAAGWIHKYGDERALQLGAIKNLDSLQIASKNKAATAADDIALRNHGSGSSDPLERSEIRALDFVQKNPNDAGGKLVLAEVRARRRHQAQSALKDKQGWIAAAWPKYLNRLDPAAQTFRDHQKKFENDAADVIDRRTKALIHWLEAGLLIDSLNDFHGENVDDGALFDNALGEAIFGIGSCESGRKKIEQWVKEAKATMDTNLLYRVLALNQTRARAEIDKILAKARQQQGQRTLASTVEWTGYFTDSLKAFAEAYGLVNSGKVPSSGLRGADKFVMTAGNAIFRHFRVDGMAGHVSEKIIQHLFSIRGLVHPEDSIKLIKVQARNEQVGREQTLKRLQTGKTFMALDTPEIRSVESTELRDGWAAFKTSEKVKGDATMKGARLAAVVLLIEALNFNKLIAECVLKQDAKSGLALLASGMAISAALLEVASMPMEVLGASGAGKRSWSFVRLKLAGGILSGGATMIGGWADVVEAGENDKTGYGMLTRLFYTKGVLGLAFGTLTVASTLTYIGPLLARLTGRVALGTVVKEIGMRAAALLGARVLGMTLGAEITLVLFSLQVIIWQVTPNAIEKWIDHCAFGTKRSTGGFTTSEEQDEQLQAAMNEMSLQ